MKDSVVLFVWLCCCFKTGL